MIRSLAILLLCTYGFLNHCKAQTTALFDSLYAVAVDAADDSSKSYNYDEAAREILRMNPDSSLALEELSLKYAKKSGNQTLIADSYNSFGVIYKAFGIYDKAIESLKKSKEHAKKSGAARQEQNANSAMGLVYWEQGSYSLAIEVFYEILLDAKNREDTSSLARAYNNIANVYFEQNILDKALTNYQEAYKLAIAMNSKFGQCLLLNNIGSVYYKEKKMTLAMENFQKSHTLSVELEDVEGIGISYINFAGVYSDQKDYKKALEYHKKGLEVKQQLGDQNGQSVALNEIGKDFEALGDRRKGIFYSKGSLNLAKEIGAKELERSAYETLYKMYDALGDKSEAYFYYKHHIELRDSITNKESRSKDLKSELNFEFKKQLFADSLEQIKKDIIALKEIESEKQKTDAQKRLTYFFIVAFIVMMILSVYIFKAYNSKKKANEIITKQKKEVEYQSDIINEKNQEITDSIQYAKRIQSAILPPNKLVKQYLQESFILYKPKDIVAGDFYWMEHKDGKVLFAAADCTGHGVPGAMVSVICNNGLNRSVREMGLTDPGEILNQTRKIVVQEFEKSEEEVKDGMDIALCSLEVNILKFAGAHNPLWIFRNGELLEYKGDKQPIGQFEFSKPFTTHTITLQKGDIIYIFSDGYVDQFGGEKGKKFKSRSFKELLLSISDKEMEQQRMIIDETFETWKGDLEQIDDVCVIGVRI